MPRVSAIIFLLTLSSFITDTRVLASGEVDLASVVDTFNQNLTNCTPFGVCETCPDRDLDKPFCQPFGNRQLLHCPDPETELGEKPTWGPCGRIIPQETTDFFEFLACNLGFAVIGLLAVIARSRQLALQRARHLAARIGVSSRSPMRDA